MSNSVKQERHDEAEISEMAAKLIEAHKAKLQNPPKGTPAPLVPGRSMLNYITKTNGKVSSKDGTSVCTANTDIKNSVMDERSLKGQFGWASLGKQHVPYIFRIEDKYVAVRIVETKVLNKYLSFLHQDIYNCTCIRSYYITDGESRLLNEINFIHADGQFGRDQFTGRDLIVRLSDAVEFYNFLDACYTKLLNGSSNPLDRCGFIRINKESVVPYTIYSSDKFVPLFYFEGETDNLKLKANKLEGWDLSYLKFCCKVQGIRNELFQHDSCSVISLNDIRNYFPPGTTFEDYWPQKMVDTQYLINQNPKTAQQPPVGQWTRQPSGPPIISNVPAPAKPAAAPAKQPSIHNLYNAYNVSGNSAAQNPYQNRLATAATRSTYNTNSVPRQARPTNYNYTPPPPPLVRQQSQPTSQLMSGSAYPNVPTSAAGYLMMGNETYRQGAPASKYAPPPLIPVRHLNGGIRYENTQNQYPSVEVVDLSSQLNQPAQQQVARSQPLQQDDRTNGTVNSSARKLIQIPDTPTSGSHIPYKMQKALIEGQPVPSINMKPYVHTELLVTISDLVNNFFNNMPVQSCQQVMQVLGIELYKANAAQMHVLLENGKCQNPADVCPLVQVRNVIDYMPHLKYMLGGMEVASKRS